ncbi:peptidylprolyl isomerase [Trifolium repens]|nr:peptidylprolyl isomerase [Trifolium repens]
MCSPFQTMEILVEDSCKGHYALVSLCEQGRSMKSDEEQKIATSLRVSCWLNDASWLHLNDFLRAIKLCIQIVSVQRCSSFKAYTPYSISIG